MVLMAVLSRGNRSATSIEVYHAGAGDSMGKEVREAEIMGSEMVETQGCRPSVLSAGCQTTGSTLSCGEKASAAFASAASATAETKTTSNHAASAASREESSNLPGSAPNIGENRNGVAPSALSDITTKPGPACENQQDCQDNQLRIPGAKKSLRKAEDGSKIPIPENVKLIRKLGEGVFAMVILAEIAGKVMAIKTIKPHASYGDNAKVREAKFKEAKEGIQTEIDVFEALSNRPRHNNIVRYFGHDAHETMIMFEPCTSSLKDFVLNCQATAGDCEWRLSVQDAEKWTVGILRGLSHLHGLARPIIHRDLKPDNILIDKKGNAKICDFNLAREVGPRERMAGWLMTGGIGSYRYMAPEVLISTDHEGSAVYGPEVDVYSAAMCMYFMITGQTPFQTMSASSAARKTFSGERPAWDHVSDLYPSTLTACMVEAWTHKPICRPSAMNLVRVLTAAQLMQEPTASAPSPQTSKILGQWQQTTRFANLPRATMVKLKSIDKWGPSTKEKESASAAAVPSAAAVAASHSTQAVALPWNRPVQTAKFLLAATRPATTQNKEGWAKTGSQAVATNIVAVPAISSQSPAVPTGIFKSSPTSRSASISAATSSMSPSGAHAICRVVSRLATDSLDLSPPVATSHVGFSRVLSGLRGARGRAQNGDVHGRGTKTRHTPSHIVNRRHS